MPRPGISYPDQVMNASSCQSIYESNDPSIQPVILPSNQNCISSYHPAPCLPTHSSIHYFSHHSSIHSFTYLSTSPSRTYPTTHSSLPSPIYPSIIYIQPPPLLTAHPYVHLSTIDSFPELSISPRPPPSPQHTWASPWSGYCTSLC